MYAFIILLLHKDLDIKNFKYVLRVPEFASSLVTSLVLDFCKHLMIVLMGFGER
jgi:hypothetical protein